ncbi:hypothetical protein FACS1894133_3300 [Clostridia bacterium]|nr:hypothetical protein FACS1894133_3300 [Clostridia bacterium]
MPKFEMLNKSAEEYKVNNYPLSLTAHALVRNAENGELFAVCKLKNVLQQAVVIKAAQITLNCRGGVNSGIVQVYRDLTVPKGEEFGGNVQIKIPAGTVSFDVILNKVLLDSGKGWLAPSDIPYAPAKSDELDIDDLLSLSFGENANTRPASQNAAQPANQPYGAPPPANQPYGAPPPANQQYGAPPANPQYGAPPPANPQYGAPPPANPPYGAPPPANQQYGAPPANQPYGAPPPANQQYGAPPPANPPYGAPPANQLSREKVLNTAAQKLNVRGDSEFTSSVTIGGKSLNYLLLVKIVAAVLLVLFFCPIFKSVDGSYEGNLSAVDCAFGLDVEYFDGSADNIDGSIIFALWAVCPVLMVASSFIKQLKGKIFLTISILGVIGIIVGIWHIDGVSFASSGAYTLEFEFSPTLLYFLIIVINAGVVALSQVCNHALKKQNYA